MKKKAFILLVCAAAAVTALVGCNNNGQAENPPEETVVIADESLPPLSEDLQELYKGAYTIYYDISFGMFEADENDTLIKDDFTYYRVKDNRFQDYDAFRGYLENYFTKDYINEEILNETNILFTKGDNGGLYFLNGGRGSNIYYAGHTFQVERETEKEIDLVATAYYTNSNEPYDGNYFYTAPEDPDAFTEQVYSFVLLKEDGNWKFDSFSLFY